MSPLQQVVIFLTVLVGILMVGMCAVMHYTIRLRNLIDRLDKKLAEHLRNDPDYHRVSDETLELAKKIGVDLGFQKND